MDKVLRTLCVCLCVSFVSCQYGFFPSRQERRQDGGFGLNFLPDSSRVTAQLAGILHLRPENQNSNPAYVYPFDRRPGITNQRYPDGYQQPNAYGQNQYNPNQYNQQNPNQFEQNQQYPNGFGQNQQNQQYPNQFGQNQQNQQYPNQFGQNQQNQQYPNQFGQNPQNQQNPNQFGQNQQNQQYPNEFGQNSQNQQYPNQFGQNQQFNPEQNGQSLPFGQSNDNQGGQVAFPTSDPSKVNFVNNFNEPDPPSVNGPGGKNNEGNPNDPVPSFENRNNFISGVSTTGFFNPTCDTVDKKIGSCISLLQCPQYLKVVQDSRNNPNAIQLLRRAHCGFEGNNPKVCCPRPGIPTAQPDTPAPPPVVLETTTTTTPAPTFKTVDGDFVASLPEPPVCGVSNASFSRVVGGVKAKLGDFPWMALLGYKSRRGSGARWLCGGSLVTNKHVLTAAHCIHGHEDDLFLVRLGELDLENDSEGATPVDVPIKSKIKHEEYSSTAFTNDIGILLLEREVTFTHLIKPICIPKDSELRARSFVDYNPIIAGWGDTEFQGPSATHLQALQLPVVSNDFCAQAYTAYKKQQIDERVLCAGYKKGGRDACQGDSGGPLMQPIWNEVDYTTHFYQIGVVSFGKKCAEAGFPGVYSRVTYFVPWLEQKLLGTA